MKAGIDDAVVFAVGADVDASMEAVGDGSGVD